MSAASPTTTAIRSSPWRRSRAAASPSAIDKPVPAFALPALEGGNGKRLASEDLRGRVALVNFWASWCAPCRTLAPTIDAIATQYAGKLKVGKLNVEENGDVPMRYGITALPTLLILKGGKVAEQRVGLVSKDVLVRLVNDQLV